MLAAAARQAGKLAIAAGALLLTVASGSAAEGDCVTPPRRQEREPAVLERSGRAARIDGMLRLSTGAGPIELQDNSAACEREPVDECRRYGLVDWIAEHGWLVVHAEFWETEAYLVVVAATGEQIALEGYPWPSPDGSRFATVTGNESGEVFNGIDVWRVEGTMPRLERRFENEPGSSGIEFFCLAGWHGDARIDLLGTRYVDHPPTSSVKVPTVLTRSGQDWELRIGMR
jgi:hypothetical protein